MAIAPSLPAVQLVSKPVVPPFSDGSKCLVRDLCAHLSTVQAHVFTDGTDASALGDNVVAHSVYGNAGGFSPALRQNLRVLTYLLLRSRAQLWHFVFAPNPLSSQMAQVLKRFRGIPTIQTIASPPRSFSAPQKLLFGDIVVAQSDWTREQFLRAYDAVGRTAPRIEVLPPPAPELKEPSAEAVQAVRSRFELNEGDDLFLYPGDLEVSRGADEVIRMSSELSKRLPNAKVVIAYRDKTSGARTRAAELQAAADPKVLRFECNVPDIHALVKASTAILFPVDDLYGKVDLPIVLLEAFRLKTPVLALDEGPLSSLQGATLLGAGDDDWIHVAERAATESAYRASLCVEGLAAIESHYRPSRVAQGYEALYAALLAN